MAFKVETAIIMFYQGFLWILWDRFAMFSEEEAAGDIPTPYFFRINPMKTRSLLAAFDRRGRGSAGDHRVSTLGEAWHSHLGMIHIPPLRYTGDIPSTIFLEE